MSTARLPVALERLSMRPPLAPETTVSIADEVPEA